MSSHDLANILVEMIKSQNEESAQKSFSELGLSNDIQVIILEKVCTNNHIWSDFNYEILAQFIAMNYNDVEVEEMIAELTRHNLDLACENILTRLKSTLSTIQKN